MALVRNVSITEEKRLVALYLSKGFRPAEIAESLNLTRCEVYTRMRILRADWDVETNEQLMFEMGRAGSYEKVPA